MKLNLTFHILSTVSSLAVWLVIFQIVSSHAVNGIGFSSRPQKDKRTNPCLQVAIKLYNLTSGFEERILMTVKQEYFENILGKEGQEVVDAYEQLEADIVEHMEIVESWNGVRPRDETGERLERFTLLLEEEYELIRDQTIDFAAKLKEAHGSVLDSKKGLIEETTRFSKLRKNFVKCKPILHKIGIFLYDPLPGTAESHLFDISILLDLQKVLKEITTIENQIAPIVQEYENEEDIPSNSDDAAIIKLGLERLEVLERVQLTKILTENDVMLRQYERILNEAVNVCLQRIVEVSAEFEELQEVVIKTADEHIGYDRKLRKVIHEYMALYEASTLGMMKEAFGDDFDFNFNRVNDKDEL